MKRKLFYLTSNLLLTLSLLGVLFIAFLPKYFLVERIAAPLRVFILSKGVQEGFNDLLYREGFIAYGGRRIANFTLLRVSLLPLPRGQLLCPSGGYAKTVLPSPLEVDVDIENFDCSPYIKTAEGALKLLRHEIYGDITLSGVKLENAPLKGIEKIELHFLGKKFTGTIWAMGSTFTGGGTFKWDLFRPSEIYIDATFRGNGLVITLRGPIENPRIEVQ